MLVVVITGPPGAGKSTTATLAHDALGDAGTANALIEVDELERCYPPLPDGRAMLHLAALARSYREVGHELLFVTATLEDDEDRIAVLRAAGGDDHLVLRLEAPPALLRSRIEAREPASWSGLGELLDASARLAVQMRELPGVDLVLDSAIEDADAVAARIVAAVRERRGATR